MTEKDLDTLRQEINTIDEKIVQLLDERAELVKKIGEYKKNKNIPVYHPEREQEVRDRVLAVSRGIFPQKALIQIFTEIMSAARSLEETLRIAYLGPEGTHTEQAVIRHFGSSVELQAFHTIPDVFREVENGKTHFGVVPIENSLEGTVNITLDEFVDSPLQIVGETYLSIHHCLMANVEKITEIKRVYSHPQAFAQCRLWLETNLPNVERIETSSTAKAASMVPWDKFSAAIAGPLAAEKYGLRILEENIEDNPENYTRFWVIGQAGLPIQNPNKTTILVSVKDRPGALLKLLSPFQVYDINLSKIESRPSKRRPWDYLFFIDIDAGINHKGLQKALEKIKEDAVFVKVLGSYMKGTL
jgi:chorismate mutase/prephenate dehydratase